MAKETTSPAPEYSPENRPDYSLVIPLKNEEDNVRYLAEEIAKTCQGTHFETIFVNDGSTDTTADVLRELRGTYPWLRVLTHPNSGGQSSAVHSGVLAARAPIICTLDGDGQNPPAEIPNMIAPLMAADAPDKLALVAGQRVKRQDTLSKKLASKFANKLRAFMLRDATRDTGCGLKAFRRDVFVLLPYFNNMHRYLPALFAGYGWQVAHVDVSHAGRHAGSSNYTNFQRALVGVRDLLGVAWLIARAKRTAPLPEDE